MEYIDKMMSPKQNSFIPKRNIHENIGFAREMLHIMNQLKGKKGYFVIKVDLAKAYDKLIWKFIRSIMI